MSSQVITDVFRRLVAGGESTLYPQGGRCPFSGQGLRPPRGPGDKVYDGSAEVTSTRIMGADAGYPQPSPQNVPQAAINANIKSFIDGLHLAFPDDAVRAYFAEVLEQDSLHNTVGSDTAGDINMIRDMLPRVLGHESPPGNARSFRLSLEQDIRHIEHGDESVLDMRFDRMNMSDKDLLATYRFMEQHPEHWAGFYLWQKILENYGSTLAVMLKQHLKPILNTRSEPRIFDDIDDEIIHEMPVFHTISFTHGSAGIPTIPLFFIAAALAVKADGSDEPSAHDYIDSATEVQKAGIFRRKFNSQFGPRTVVCPFSGAAVRWLTMDMQGNGHPEDSAIAKCITKVVAERKPGNRADRLCDEIADMAGRILSFSDERRIAEIDTLSRQGTCPRP